MTQVSEEIVVKETKLYSEAVKLTGYGKYNLFILLATGGCLMCVIIESMSMSFIIPAAHCDLGLNITEKGVLVSINFLGIILTSHFWGTMADVRGRKNILVLCLIVGSIISLAASLAPWTWLFILLRLLNGMFIGAASSIIYAFAGEFHDDRYRPMVISWISSFVAAGQSYIPGLAWAILPYDWHYNLEALGIEFRPWRLLLIVYALPSLIVAALLSFLPESPKFLLAQGKHDHTLKILRQMFVINTGKKSHEFPVSTVILDEVIIERSVNEEKPGMLKSLWTQTVFLFNKEFAVKTVLCSYLQFGVFLSTSALSLWFPQILNALNKYAQEVTNSGVTLCGAMEAEQTVTNQMQKTIFIDTQFLWKEDSDNSTIIQEVICDDSVDTGVYLVVLVVACAIGIAYLIIGALISRVGKKTLLISASTFTAACGLGAQYCSGLEIILILCGIYLLIASMVGVVNALVVDLYPTHIRAMALAVSLMFGRVGAMVGSNLMGVLFYSYCDYVFIFVACNHLLLVVAAILLPTTSIKKPVEAQETIK
ncbi:synaptic vesicle glycoprotein 2C-like [Anthonomus grandis grandis]|uniref:synaptic vesicle glycoprotein 2C-like n=1 Tax=Anthonomus grandis grandis TaxID=2921223 RepID=UPI002165AF38|nr:synaptic vesicle glycoprotein 2C-like [Anthonomus grandis grandis]